MAIYGFNALTAWALMPLSGQTVNGQPFSIPRGALGITIHCPDLLGVATTIKLQALDPPRDDQESETWRDVSIFDLSAGTFRPIAAIPENAATTLPITAFGGGVFRWVASADQSSTPLNIKMSINVGN